MPKRTIKMRKNELIKEHKRITKLIDSTLNILNTIIEKNNNGEYLTNTELRRLMSLYERLVNEYEEQKAELLLYERQ